MVNRHQSMLIKKSIAHAKPFMHNSIVESLMFYHRYQKSHVQWRVTKKIYRSSYQIAWIEIMEQPSNYDMKYQYKLQLILRNYCSFFLYMYQTANVSVHPLSRARFRVKWSIIKTTTPAKWIQQHYIRNLHPKTEFKVISIWPLIHSYCSWLNF